MIQFGTGGWRAIIGDEFIRTNIQKLSKALAQKMKEEGVNEKGIIIGYDRRFLSKEAMQWCGEVFAAEGIVAKLVTSSVPTPLIMYYVMKHDLPYGMMITASHNGATYNGIKVFTSGGRDADEVQTSEIEGYIRQIKEDVAILDYDKAIVAGMIEEINPMNEYIDSIMEQVDTNAIREASPRIVIDPMYGVSLTALRTILLSCRCTVETIHDNHDTLFGGKMPAPDEITIRALQNYVIDYNYDMGVATDGDADRIGVVDDKGNFLRPNDVLVLLYYYLTTYKHWHGPVVRNIATTHMLDYIAADFGEKCYEVPVGFKYISAKMKETNAIIGGESSGGLTVKGHILGKDGIYAATLLAEMIALTGKKISELMEDIHTKYTRLYMVEYSCVFEKERKEELKVILEKEELFPDMGCEIDHVSYLDGCKVYFRNGGWIIARFSGTEPLLRIFCEMQTLELARKTCEILKDYLRLN